MKTKIALILIMLRGTVYSMQLQQVSCDSTSSYTNCLKLAVRYDNGSYKVDGPIEVRQALAEIIKSYKARYPERFFVHKTMEQYEGRCTIDVCDQNHTQKFVIEPVGGYLLIPDYVELYEMLEWATEKARIYEASIGLVQLAAGTGSPHPIFSRQTSRDAMISLDNLEK